jgi:hypothetical protein
MSSEKAHEAAARECQRMTAKILLVLTSKRSDEEWEFFKNRTIEMFRQKGLFKNESPAQPAPPASNPQKQQTTDK